MNYLLTATMSFIDDEETDLAVQQVLEEIPVLEALGREIEQLTLTCLDLTMCFATLERGEVRMHCHCIDTLSCELVLLVLHQGDERTHHDGKAGHQESRKLIDDGLAAACRHYDECITTVEKRLNGCPLPASKVDMTEPLRED